VNLALDEMHNDIVQVTPTVLVGPSGVGKGSVLAAVCAEHSEVWLSVSVTTRAPRPGEVEGRSYFFVTDADFDQMIVDDGLLEWASYQQARYGTPRAPVEQAITDGRAVIFEVDVQGARQIRDRLNPLRTVFLAPPSWEDLERRLRGRGTEPEAVIARRLDTARRELLTIDEWDHVIVNTEVALAASQLVDLIGLGL